MADDWTAHVDTYIAQLAHAQLIPPINGVKVAQVSNRPVLWIDVPVPPTDEITARIEAVLGSVPHQIRHVPLADGGRRPGVTYG